MTDYSLKPFCSSYNNPKLLEPKMSGLQQSTTYIKLYYYILIVTTLNSAKIGDNIGASAQPVAGNTCMDVLTETYKPDADVILGFIGSKRLSSSSSSLCDLSNVQNEELYEAAKIIVDNPPSTVQLPNITLGKYCIILRPASELNTCKIRKTMQHKRCALLKSRSEDLIVVQAWNNLQIILTRAPFARLRCSHLCI